MKTVTIGEFKANLSTLTDKILKGEEVVVTRGRTKKKILRVLAFNEEAKPKKRKLGPLEGKGSFKIHDGFEMSAEELLGE